MKGRCRMSKPKPSQLRLKRASRNGKTKPKRRGYTTDELMKNFKPEHRHGEWDIGTPVGKEIW